MMARYLIAAVCLLASSLTFGAVSSAVISGLTKTGSAYSIKSASATVTAGALSVPATITSAGRTITMPATESLASNAAQFAISAIRLNPAAMVAGLTAQWLIGKGLNYLNGTWNQTSNSWEWGASNGIFRGATPQAAGQAFCTQFGRTFSLYSQGVYDYSYYCVGDGTLKYGYAYCVGNGTQYTGIQTCPQTATHPATEGDFAAVTTITDGAATELVKVLDMPVNAPVLTPTAVDTYGTPYYDPVSGRMVKERTVATPDPTPTDPLNVRLERYQVDAGAVTGQTANPVAAPKESNVSDQPKVDEVVAPVTDTALGALPTLYERKYPDGFSGVWTVKKAALNATPLGLLLPSMVAAPSVGAGTCPVWTLSGAVLGISVAGNMAPPCWLWAVLKTILIITALFVSRRIIFGG